jgi:hypothetical protein
MRIKLVVALLFLTLASAGAALAQVEIGSSIDALCIPACGTIHTSGGLGKDASGSLLDFQADGDLFSFTFKTGRSLTYSKTDGKGGDWLAKSTYGRGGTILITGPDGLKFKGTFTGGSSTDDDCTTKGRRCFEESIDMNFTGVWNNGEKWSGSFDLTGTNGGKLDGGDLDMTQTPEPTSIALFGGGALVAWLRNRRAKVTVRELTR